MTEEWLTLGPHHYRVCGDIFEWSPRGIVELEHARQFVALTLAHSSPLSYLAILSDGQKLSPLSSQVRACYVQAIRSNRHLKFRFVVFGAPWLTKVSQTLAVRAAARLANLSMVFRHVATREQGLALLQEMIREPG